MPTYDYKCRNTDCENPGFETKFCSIANSKVYPICDSCGHSMPKTYTAMPAVSWIYLNPSGQKRTSSMGPAQRADRRHNGWHNGVKQLKPIHKSAPTRKGRKVNVKDAETQES